MVETLQKKCEKHNINLISEEDEYGYGEFVCIECIQEWKENMNLELIINKYID